MAKPYPERLASMFKAGARAADVERMISESAELIAASEAAESDSRATAMDPAASETDAVAARRAADDHAFATERLAESRRRLESRLKELKESEQSKAQAAEYEQIAADNQALAAEVRDVVPDHLEQLAEIFARIEANDLAIVRANSIRPGDKPPLVSAEFVARGCNGVYWPPSNINPVERLTAMRLPRFETWGHIWPIDRMAATQRDLQEAARRQRLHYEESNTPAALAKAKAQMDSQFGRYVVRQARYAGHPTGPVRHRYGKAFIYNHDPDEPQVLELDAHLVEQARAAGMIVKRLEGKEPLGVTE